MGRTWLSFLIVLIGSSASNLRAQQRAADLTMLEEWMDVDVIPIDVLDAHIHLKGDWMIGYRTMYVRMGESRSTEADFMIPPTGMMMDMHMLDVMIGLTDRLTLIAMMPFSRMSMGRRTSMGVPFSTAAHGPEDVELTAHYGLYYPESRLSPGPIRALAPHWSDRRLGRHAGRAGSDVAVSDAARRR